jgi:ArsR family transcriptional regulator, arsenate/arsenite/antimonite-responsive transcriptional repressor
MSKMSLTYQWILIYVHVMSRAIAHQIKEASRLFHALSEPTRLQILEHLKDGEQCVCELTEVFHTGQSRLSFHLRVLKEAGLIKDRPEGRWMYYSLNFEGIQQLESFVNALQESRPSRRSSAPYR